jgi:hypothetical protein
VRCRGATGWEFSAPNTLGTDFLAGAAGALDSGAAAAEDSVIVTVSFGGLAGLEGVGRSEFCVAELGFETGGTIAGCGADTCTAGLGTTGAAGAWV